MAPTVDTRTERLIIRMTPEEKAMLRTLATQEGLTGSDYVRAFIRRAYAEVVPAKKPKR